MMVVFCTQNLPLPAESNGEGMSSTVDKKEEILDPLISMENILNKFSPFRTQHLWERSQKRLDSLL